LGIATDGGGIHERSAWNQWYELWPTPTVSVAVFLEAGQGPPGPMPDVSSMDAKRVFREDSFDATTRIRRGRFYESSGTMQGERVLPHLVHPGAAPGLPEVSLRHFMSIPQKPSAKLVAIGAEDSVWRILDAERISTGEWLVTLKARGAMGVLPELDVGKIPEDRREEVVRAVDRMVDVAHRETPGSIVDVARGVAQLLMGTYAAGKETDSTEQRRLLAMDLGEIVRHFENHKDLKGNVVTVSIGKILARLHPRNKSNEQHRLGLRPITEEDGVFAVNAIGLLLNEFKWTRDTA
ncbi:MAG: hypothetical protein ACYDHM_16330, partial [Acidiferrobacterales bacterium]